MSRLDEVAAKVDAFFARVAARHGDDMQCETGCSDCCHVRLTITSVEAAAIRSEVAAWPAERRAALVEARPRRDDAVAPDPQRAVVAPSAADRCAALDPSGRCRIYAVRPIVCRSHGAPIRMQEDPRRRSLPVVQSCFRNFTRTEPDADCVVDQTTLSALVLAVDRAAGGSGDRVDLAALLAELAAV